MIAAQDSSDRSDCAASSFSYEEMFSVLMYYTSMSKEDILKCSRKFLYALYQRYVRRACENLGINPDKDSDNGETQLSDNDYPSEWVSFSQAEREKMIEESGESDEDFINKFSTLKKF